MSNSPIFVVGVPRSGTTLLRYVLNSTDRIHIPPESGFIPRFFGRRPLASIRRHRAQHILDVIFDEYGFASQWQSDRPSAETLIGDQPNVTPSWLLDALYREYAAQFGAVRWGDKTPAYTNHMALLGGIFPDAKFVHVIRDVRDVVISTLEAWSSRRRHIDVYYAARNWSDRVGRARTEGRRLGVDRYFEVRYERLVADAEPVIRATCEFLDEPFVSEMLQPEVIARQQLPPGSHEGVRHPITAARAGRWRGDLAPQDLRLVEQVAGPALTSFGYEASDATEMTTRELARCQGLATKYAVNRAGRRALQTVGVFRPN
jgi:hypothetical protein